MPSFPFLRRSASVTDIPIIPPAVPNGPSPNKRTFFSIPTAAASTNDLPNFTSPPLSPGLSRPQPSMTRQSSAALGPKAGARFLASKEARRALRKAEEFGASTGGGEFAIEEVVPFRPDGGLSTVTGSAATEVTEIPAGQPQPQPKHDSSSGGRTRSGSTSNATSKGVRRVPVPSVDEYSFPTTKASGNGVRPEKSIQELTKRASQEDQQQNEEALEQRRASLSKASAAGLSSPFVSPAAPTTLESKKRRAPPVSGLNKTVLPEVDEHGRQVPSMFTPPHPRQRSASADSRASVSKDTVLSQLGEAIKRERKKADAYERETEQSEVELAEIERNLEVLKEKFATTLDQQQQVIDNLAAEIEEVEGELERVNDLDEAAAQEYLSLLTSPSFDALKARAPVVQAFNPTALTSSPSTDLPPALPGSSSEKPKFSPFAFRRALSLKRRVDTHVAAYDSVASNLHVPKPPLPRNAAPLAAESASTPLLRPRKLSKTRPPLSFPVERSPPPPVSPPVSSRQNGAPPPPAPIFPAGSAETSSPLAAKGIPTPVPPKSKKRAPPVSGVSRNGGAGGGAGGKNIISGLLGGASDSEAEDGGVKGRNKPGAGTRKRSNSFTKTLRILFPSNAARSPPSTPQQQQGQPHFNPVRPWLQSDGGSYSNA
ncbi:hypothetical protein JCM8547_005175 [Rhodosporidiobolus lusitaniae]